MLVKVISQYLETNRRLVVPHLGAFIVKTPFESILFSELLKRDDGVLRGLLVQTGMSEIEAAGAIDRFVFEIRHAIKGGNKSVLEGFGAMSLNAGDIIVFEYYPKSNTTSINDSVTVSGADSDAPTEEVINNSSEVNSNCATDDVLAENKYSANGGKVIEPDPDLKGLCYGKPTKNTNAYRYVGSKKKKKKMDSFLIIAIIAAIIAIAAIAFGYYLDADEKQQNKEFIEAVDSMIGNIIS